MPCSTRRYPFVGFMPERDLGKDVLTVKDISVTVDGVKLLDKVYFSVNRTDKIAFVGENELAQTALMKVLMGELEPDEGSIKWGISTIRSYLPKDNSEYFEGNKMELVDWLRQYSAKKNDVYLRGFLGRMLFGNDDVFKPVDVLSGGEKVRCMLSKMMLSGANVVLLDQPTNHLDMESIQAVMSEGAWVVPVAEETDKKEVPPMILVKSDGSAIYATTDLATLVQRTQDWNPDKVLYVTDKRQNLHFEQFFRAARKSGIVKESCELEHIGFGTMNGKDGKPFKTRDGGVLRLEQLVDDMTDFVRTKVVENKIVSDDEVEATTRKIALAALKYGDLSNQPTKDYIFDMDRFASFEGNTGPYILYTIVRVKSILSRYGAWENLPIRLPANDYAKDLMLAITKLGPTLEAALANSAPNQICAYIYELAGAVNKFYHETPILREENEELKAGHIALIGLAKDILERSIDIPGFAAPEKM